MYKPRIKKIGDYWYVIWFNGYYPTYRCCYLWSIAVEQLHRLYGMGEVVR